MLQNRFKHRLQSGEQLVGAWCMSGSPTLVEAMGCAGFDHLVIDMEHGPAPLHDLRGLLQAADASGALPVVRMADFAPTAIKQALDLGALNLVFPYVQTAEEARAIARAGMYAPQGERGYARMHRGSRYTTQADYVARANEEVLLIPQIETPLGFKNFEAIVETPGIGGLLFGPGDFAMCLGHGGDVNHPEVRAAMETVGRYCRDNKRPLGTVMPTPEAVKWAFDAGFNFVSLASEMGFAMAGARGGIGAIRGLLGGAAQ